MKKKIPEIGQVLECGYCVGCGACSAVSRKFGMKLTDRGYYIPDISSDDASLVDVSSVCPFSSEGLDENEIGVQLFAANKQHHEALGYYVAAYAGHVAEGTFRATGSSGGMGSWILAEALQKGIVDTIIHVKAVDPREGGKLFGYTISRTVDEIRQGGKSKYYPVTLSEGLAYVLDNPGNYAIVGVPCFVKAIRRIAFLYPEIGQRIKLVLGLVCGHLKTTGFAESLAWQIGISPTSLASVDFRHKLEVGPASRYAFKASSTEGQSDVVAPMTSLLGRDWGMSFFKLNACEYCDDVMAETADISIGDAWLPEYKSDSSGTNIVIVRKPELLSMITNAIEEKRLNLNPITPERAALSQDAGIRHRREGLAYRLWLKDIKGQWRPKKRVQANALISPLKKAVFLMRMLLMKRSVDAFKTAKEKNKLPLFLVAMKPWIFLYYCIYVCLRLMGLLWRRK